MNKTILITGFDPFGGETVNPSFEAVKRLPDEMDGFRLVKLEVPTVFGKGPDMAAAAAAELSPCAVLCTGQAGGRRAITPEVIAVNLRHARIADNEGCRPEWEKIDPAGPDGIFTTLPVREMADSMSREGIPASLSFTAGSFVCNELMYRMLREEAAPYTGFIHVPYIPEQTAAMENGEQIFSMPPEQIVQALRICIRTVCGLIM